MEKQKWEKASFPGVRFYKHKTRRYGVKYDQYFSGSYQVNKKRKNIGFGWGSEGWTEKDVWEKLNQYKYNAKNGTGPTTLKEEARLKALEKESFAIRDDLENSKNITFAQFYDKYYTLSANGSMSKETTFIKEKSYFKVWLLPAIGHLKFCEITSIHFENLKTNLLGKDRSPRTLQQCFAIFDKVWNHAKKYDLVNVDSPTKAVVRPRVENNCTRFYTHDEAGLLLKKLKKRSRQVHDMTLFSLHTGVRAGEIFSLTWGVVNFENHSALIRDSKGKMRHAFLTDTTYDMLKKKYNGQAPSDLLFTNLKGQKLKSIGHTFIRTVRDLKFNDGVTDRRDKATFHTCRHTFASWHVQNGTDLYTVKELLGHSTIQLTERYSHLRPDGLKKAAQMFDEKVIKTNVAKLEKIENG